MPDEATTNDRRNARSASAPKRAADGATPKREAGQAKADVTVRELLFLVSRVAAGFEATLKTKTSALSLSQWAMLEMLSQEDGSARPSQLARKLGFSRQLVRLATKKLLALELVAKDTPEEGKKAVGLSLTDAGRNVLTDIATSTDAMSASLKDDKRGGSVNQAARTLRGLSAALPATEKDGANEKGGVKGRKKKAEVAEAAPPA